jgi:hypothetical protein
MAEQNFKNHSRIDPLFHYGIIPVLLVNVIFAVVRCVHSPSAWHGWNILLALALLLLASLMRTYALRVQDRVIRLEERIRIAALLPLESQPLQRELTTGQIIALRFASDAELTSLAERAVRERLSPKAIKQQIEVWRPDTHRV